MANVSIQRFRIAGVQGPEGIGPLNRQYVLSFQRELDPGERYSHESGRRGLRGRLAILFLDGDSAEGGGAPMPRCCRLDAARTRRYPSGASRNAAPSCGVTGTARWPRKPGSQGPVGSCQGFPSGFSYKVLDNHGKPVIRGSPIPGDQVAGQPDFQVLPDGGGSASAPVERSSPSNHRIGRSRSSQAGFSLCRDLTDSLELIVAGEGRSGCCPLCEHLSDWLRECRQP